MGMSSEDWKLNELETVKSMLQFYRTRLEKIEEDDQLRYISRDEFVRFSKSMVQGLEISMQQMQRMLDCLGQIIDALSALTDEVAELKSRTGRLEKKL